MHCQLARHTHHATMTEVASPSAAAPPPPPMEPRVIPADDEALIRSLVEDVNQTASKIARRTRGEPPQTFGGPSSVAATPRATLSGLPRFAFTPNLSARSANPDPPPRFDAATRAELDDKLREIDNLTRTVEAMERELSRRDVETKTLRRELATARAEVEERDAQIAEVCAEWERNVSSAQKSRDADVASLESRMRHLSDVELAALKARLEDAEGRAAKATARAEAAEARAAAAEQETRRQVAERDRKLALSAEDFRRASAEWDRKAAELSQRYAARVAEDERRHRRTLETFRAAWDEEREEMRREMQTVTAGAAAFVRREVLNRHGLSSARPDGAIFDEDAVRRMLRNPTAAGHEVGHETEPNGGNSAIPVVIPVAGGAGSNSFAFHAPPAASPPPPAVDAQPPAPDAREVPEARASAPARTTSAPADVASAKPKKEKSGSFFGMFKASKKSGMKLEK